MSNRIDPRAPLAAEVRRIATQDVEAALGHLYNVHDGADEALHECRKRLKSLRALLRLVRSGDEPFALAENIRYRDAARLLAGPRQAGALIETLDRLEREFSRKTAHGALDAVRDRLAARRRDALEQDLAHAVSDATKACKSGLLSIERLTFQDDPDSAADILATGLRKARKRTRKSLDKARKRGDANDFHDLRKAMKTYSRYLSLLRKHWPSPVKPQRKSLDALTERLGELHDVFVLRALLRDETVLLGGAADGAFLDKLCRRSERKLRKACLTQASELMRASAKTPARRLARNVRRSRAGSSRPTA
jgi:CHAD domain-containing protein